MLEHNWNILLIKLLDTHTLQTRKKELGLYMMGLHRLDGITRSLNLQ